MQELTSMRPDEQKTQVHERRAQDLEEVDKLRYQSLADVLGSQAILCCSRAKQVPDDKLLRF